MYKLVRDISAEEHVIDGVTYIGVKHLEETNSCLFEFNLVKEKIHTLFKKHSQSQSVLVCEENLDSWLEYTMDIKLPYTTYMIDDHKIKNNNDRHDRRSHYMFGYINDLKKTHKNIVVVIGYLHLQDIINIYNGGLIYNDEFMLGLKQSKRKIPIDTTIIKYSIINITLIGILIFLN
jgi:hypothetical protein